jgi:hypothetical protein
MGALFVLLVLCCPVTPASPAGDGANQAASGMVAISLKNGEGLFHAMERNHCNADWSGFLVAAYMPDKGFENLPAGVVLFRVGRDQCAAKPDAKSLAITRRMLADEIARVQARHARDLQAQLDAANEVNGRLVAKNAGLASALKKAVLDAQVNSRGQSALLAWGNQWRLYAECAIGSAVLLGLVTTLFWVRGRSDANAATELVLHRNENKQLKESLATAQQENANLKQTRLNEPAGASTDRMHKLLEELGQYHIMRKTISVSRDSKEYTFTYHGSIVKRDGALCYEMKCPHCPENNLLVPVPKDFRDEPDTASLVEHLKRCPGLRSAIQGPSSSAIAAQFPSETAPSSPVLSIVKAS